jgi:hypothetical protein
MRSNWVITLFILPVLGLLPGCGQAVLTAKIERDGEVLMSSHFTRDMHPFHDGLAPKGVWPCLRGLRFQTPAGHQPRLDEGLEITVKGKIRIIITQAGREIASATVDHLRLIRGTGPDAAWELPPDEIDRTGRAAGLSGHNVK